MKTAKGAFRAALVLLGIAAVVSLYSREIVIYLIEDYQVRISPRKGYSCAYAQRYGALSCSAYAKKIIRERGVYAGVLLVQKRFEQCYKSSAVRGPKSVPGGYPD